ncbi:unnamed protein product [Chironomus riparius]|uniref:Uncharacterized protein n=1 Tax=Chironomus riparius TaxID=315576 RepID=A0A9N9S1S2_9DIPT|nr:unnamed protein product [Chironomus riparius]
MAFQCSICLSANFNQFNTIDCGHTLQADCLMTQQTEIHLNCLESRLESLTLSRPEEGQARQQEDTKYQQELKIAKMEMKATCENLENILTLNLDSLDCLKNLKTQLIRESNMEVASEIGERVYGNLLSYLRMENPNASEDLLPPNVFEMNEHAIENYIESYRNIRTAFAELKEIELD